MADDAAASGPVAPLRSFWIGGFEGADHVNRNGATLDMVEASGHAQRFGEDYAAARALGILTVRESIGWRIAEPSAGPRHLERALAMATAARAHGIQVLWTLMHLGLPDDLSLDDDRLVARFVDFAREAAAALAPFHDDAPVYTPINEIGLTAWGAASGMFGHGTPRDADTPRGEARIERVRRRLVEAALRAGAAIRRADPRARLMAVEPLVNVVAASRASQPLARRAHLGQWRVLDELLGRESRELGGHAGALDLIGFSHYATSQWEVPSQQRLRWDGSDPRRRPLSELLVDAQRRYRLPLLLAQTSHVGAQRAAWLNEVGAQAREALKRRVPLAGVCLYPLVDRPDWDDTAIWHRSGLWDVVDDAPRTLDDDGDDTGAPLRRVPVPDYQAALRAWQQHLPGPAAQEASQTRATIVAFSPVRWHGAYGRPQQLLGRLAGRFRIVYVEEPVSAAGPARLVRSSAGPLIDVVTPFTPLGEPGFHDAQLPGLKPLLDGLFQELAGDRVLWFGTAMALPLAASLRPRAVVYDCTEEPANVEQRLPRQLRQRESALLRMAQLVLVGGPGLYEARRDDHSNLHCVPNGVDTQRFAPEALDDAGAAHEEAQRLMRYVDGQRLGYYGVIDERIDLELVEALADADVQWQIVMVGPVRIDAARLPRRPNIHWLGLQPHAVLPHLLASWDLCLLPLARHAATRHLNPGQALEFLASGKPVVSTAIEDVRTLYGEVVAVAEDHPRFIVACVRALCEGEIDRREREAATRALVNGYAWSRSAERAATLIEQVLAQPPVELPAPPEDQTFEPPPPAPAIPASARPRTRALTHLVVGGGVTGLAAAWQLGQVGLGARTLLVERAAQLGAAHRHHPSTVCEFEHADLGLPDGPVAADLMQRILGRNLQWRTTVLNAQPGVSLRAGDTGSTRSTVTLRLPGPARGGVRALVEACARRVGCQVAMETALVRLDPARRVARLDDGRSIHYEQTVSTIALPELAALCGDELPGELRSAAAALRYRPARSVWLAVRRHDPLAVDRCVLLPPRALFHRAWVTTVVGADPYAGIEREGIVVVRLDLAPLPGAARDDGPTLDELVVDCHRRGLILTHEPIVAHWDLHIAQGHPLDDVVRPGHVAALRHWFGSHGIELAGHFGAWGADHGLHALEAGHAAVERLRGAAGAEAAAVQDDQVPVASRS